MCNINKLLGETIRRIRQEKRMTQHQLAYQSGLHRAYIGHIERGEKSIGLKNLKKIADGLGVSLCMLIEPIDQKWPNKKIFGTSGFRWR